MKELAVRTISGLVFVAVTLASLIIAPSNHFPFLILFSLYLLRTVYEYLRLTMGKEKKVLKILSLTASLCLFWLLGLTLFLDTLENKFYLTDDEMFVITYVLIFFLLVSLIAMPVADLLDGGDFYLSYAFSSLFYIAIPFTLLLPVFSFNDGWAIASLLIVMWMGDVGAYCIGTAFGQGKNGHKLMPSVSPKKSWEGVYGAVAFSIITALVLRAFNLLLPSFPYWVAALFGLLICVFSILGDLVESKLKRRFQVKDSGRIMPGHGGFLDRFDSGLLAWPVAFLFYLFILIAG